MSAFKKLNEGEDAFTILKLLEQAFPKTSAAIETYYLEIATASTATEGLTAAISGLWGVLSANPILAIAAVVGIAATAYTQWQKQIEETAEAASTAVSTMQSDLESAASAMESFTGFEDEYAELSKGVNALGENVSLSSEDYERYQEIVAEIAEDIPSLVKGYNDQGTAILECADDVDELAAAYENLQDVAIETASGSLTDIWKDFYNSYDKNTDNMLAAAEKLQDLVNNYLNGYEIDEYELDEIFNDSDVRHFMGDIGLALDTGTDGSVIWEKLTSGYIAQLQTGIQEALSGDNGAGSLVKQYYESLITTFDGYDDLNSIGQQIMYSFIDGLTDTEIYNQGEEGIYSSLQEMFEQLSTISPDSYAELLGLSEIYSAGDITIAEFKQSIQDFKDDLTKQGVDEVLQDTMLSSFSLDDESINDEIGVLKNHIIELLGGDVNSDLWQGLLSSINLPLDDLRALENIDVSPDGSYTWAELRELINEAEDAAEDYTGTSGYSLSSLKDTLTTVQEAQAAANEAMYDGIVLTDDQKEAISALIDDEDKLNECFESEESNLVTNSKLLKEYIELAELQAAATAKASKMASEGDYYNLVQQLDAAMDGYNNLTDAQKSNLNSLMDNIDAAKSAINQYSLLEDQLLGTTSAFDDFANAQEIDAENDYGDQATEMLQTLMDGFTTGQLGTNAVQAAIDGLIPDEVYKGIEDDTARLDAIWSYVQKTLDKYYNLGYDEDSGEYSISIDADGIENFVNAAIKAGVLVGDLSDFDLAEDMNLEKAADLMGLTETQTYALFAELAKYDASIDNIDLLTKLGLGSVEGELLSVTEKIEDLNEERLELLSEEDGADKNADRLAEINDELKTSESELSNVYDDIVALANETQNMDDVLAVMDLADEYYEDIIENGVDATKSWSDFKKELEDMGVDTSGLDDLIDNATTAEGQLRAITEWLNEKYGIELDTSDFEQATNEAYSLRYNLEDLSDTEAQIVVDCDQDEIEKAEAEIESLENGDYSAYVDVDINDENAQSVLDDLEKAIKTGDFSAFLTIDSDNAEEKKAELEAAIESGDYTAFVDVDLDDAAQSKIASLEGDVATLQSQLDYLANTYDVTITDNAETVAGAVDDVTQSIEDMPSGKTVTITSNAPTVRSNIINLTNSINAIPSTKTVTIKYTTSGSSTGSFQGTAHAYGKAFASGNWGLKQADSNALTGELGEELIVDPYSGKWYTVGSQGAEFTSLPRGAIIFNHKQTEEIFRYGRINSRGQALAEGNAYSSLYTKKVTSSSSSSSSSSSKKSSSSSNSSSSSSKKSSSSSSSSSSSTKEELDWIEVLLDRIERKIESLQTTAESAYQTTSARLKATKSEISQVTTEISKQEAAYDYYIKKANSVGLSSSLMKKVQEGAINISDYSESTAEKIEEYQEWCSDFRAT